MFLIYCLAMLLLVYLAPALAVYPNLLVSSRTVVAVPFVSIAVIGVSQTLMSWAGFYNRPVVLALSCFLAFIAVTRLVVLLRRGTVFDWPPAHRALLLFASALGCYWAANLGTTGFDTDDEIYSWNMWAIQHYLNHEIDLYYVQASYPQLFSVLISYNYKLVGNVELQLPVRALLAIFPIALWGAIAVAPRTVTFSNSFRSIVVMLLLAGGIGRYFSTGLADPLMASSLVVAIFLFIQYRESPEKYELLVLSVVCTAVAVFSKQPALIWGLFSFPLIIFFEIVRKRLPPVSITGAIATFSLCLFWILGPGTGFHHNPGVVVASQQGRGFIEQLVFAITERFIDDPLVALFLCTSLVAVARARQHRDIALLFLVPGLIAWLLYGAYDTRLGIHLIALSALLLAATGYCIPEWLGGGSFDRVESIVRPRLLVMSIFMITLVGGAVVYRANKNIHRIGEQFSLYDAGHNTIVKYFGEDAEIVIRETYNRPDKLLWIPSNYIYGIFYGHTPVIRPDRWNPGENHVIALLREIERWRPNYLFDSGDRVAFGPGSKRLRELATDYCPELFEVRAGPPNKYGYTLYRLRNNETLIARCFEILKNP